jgi:LDH2 family malate/lactate/ureidoglycolate dehydrogenase
MTLAPCVRTYKKLRGDPLPVFKAPYLEITTSRIFQAAGAPEQHAQAVASGLVEANLAGHDSHGVIRITEYLDKIQRGAIDPAAVPMAAHETATTLSVDAARSFGQIAARWTMERVIDKARSQHMASAGIFNCGHVGLVGTYPEMAAEQGMIGLAFVSGGGSKPRVAPFGGAQPVFGTNPLAAALPVKGSRPIVMDFSTAIVASGKIRVLHDRGELLPSGWILDRDGRPSQNPADYYDGGMLLPAAGHKGYALGLLVEVLGGLLTGAGSLILPETGYKVGNGVFFMAVDVAAFRPVEEFTKEVQALGETVKSIPGPDADGGVLLPGDIERRVREQRLAEGIPVPEATWSKIVAAADALGVSLESKSC